MLCVLHMLILILYACNSSVQAMSMELEEMDELTFDGTLDVKGNPASRRSTGGFKTAVFIVVNQGLMCVSLYGISVNLAIYLTTVLREGTSSAASNTSNWQGALFLFSFIGGFLGDAYLGRYKSSLLFQLVFVIGAVLTALSATLDYLRPPACGVQGINCKKASGTQIGLFYLALYIIALGFGGYLPNLLSFGADQFDEEHPQEKVSKVKFFNWFYAAMSVGTLLASTLLAYIENEGKWAMGFWISTGMGTVALFSFLVPTWQYRFHETGGNPLCRIAQVVTAAFRKRHIKIPLGGNQLYEVSNTESTIKGSRKIIHSSSLRCLDKAAAITETDFDNENNQIRRNSWHLCTVTQVEELKWVLRMLPVWACTIFYTTAYTQVYSLFVIQGAAMDTQLGSFNVPPASLYAVDCMTVVLCVLAYNYWLLPQIRKWTALEEGLSGLQRIGVGMPIIGLAMFEAGLVEVVRRNKVQRLSNLSILWQLPLYITTGISEIFTYIGMMHFFYDQAPDAMRSLGSALLPASVALGDYVSSLLITIVGRVSGSPGWLPDSIDKGHLDFFFFLLGGLSFLNFALFSLASVHYKYTSRHRVLPSPQAPPHYRNGVR
ncbi:hypothetical protein KP509_31G039800 [Ceratopteris richardii]|uniref:Uncharacterized protein n=1 Tax=Ceratopteris richardii TaxID=49495 RepID=A0A8T2QZC6_CERRI|nr:hypothetical protein KP509_31G039800 [Ceratopteris richardii]